MQEPHRSQVDAVNPLIKIVKQREELYFQLLTFVNTHLATSSYDLDNTTIFKKYISLFDNKHSAILNREKELIESLIDPFAEGEHSDDPISKQMLRLSSRVFEILEGSLSRIQKSVFDDNGRTLKEFSRFKSTLNKILKRQYFVVKDFVQHIISYCTNKFKKQFLKLRNYLEKVELGEEIWFKELYSMHNSDVQHSPSPDRKIKDEEKTVRKLHKKIDMEQHLSSTEQREKKAISLKKTMKPSTKKRERVLNIKQKPKQEIQVQPETNKKEHTANKLYKFYVLLDLNKKQFLQDYIYEKQEQENHKNQLLGKLLQRNKAINSQINAFVKKSTNYLPIPILFPPNKSSGDERHESASSKMSLRTSFVIKRKSTSHFDTSGNQRGSDNQKKEKDELSNTIKNLNPRRRASHSNPRTQQNKSKKLFVVKAPVVFEEEIIPQAQITQTQWLQAPLTVKGREKRTQSIRMKRKNNVNPLQNAFLPQNFNRYGL